VWLVWVLKGYLKLSLRSLCRGGNVLIENRIFE
jgi:hypothetical protein